MEKALVNLKIILLGFNIIEKDNIFVAINIHDHTKQAATLILKG